MVSVDPAKHYFTAAWWQNSKLVAVRRISTHEPYPVVSLGIFEYPRYYPHSSRSVPNDLIDIGVRSALLCSHLAEKWILVPANVWKGQVPKRVIQNRLKKALSAEELRIITESHIRPLHDVWDAVGLGFWYIDRNRNKI